MWLQYAALIILVVYLAMCIFLAVYSQRLMTRGKVSQGTEISQKTRR